MAELLKNIFFTEKSIQSMVDSIKRHEKSFDESKFKSMVFDKDWKNRELKDKMRHVARCLHALLPGNYQKSIDLLKKIAPEVKGFEAMTLPDFVEQYGQAYFDESLEALSFFTRYSSSEFAIRPFIAANKEKVMKYMLQLAGNDNPNVRRFSSEGCRPRLPWAMALPDLQKDPSLILPILEKLKDDESDSVRRSVANNLNDISKDHPALVIRLCRLWKGKSKNTDAIIRHALRTLLKKGDKDAMMFYGYSDPGRIKIKSLTLNNKEIKIGENSGFKVIFQTPKKGKLRLDYAIFYKKANGKLSKKIFFISENSFLPGQHAITRKLSFVDMTTRKHYPGEHFLAFHVNGVELKRVPFLLN